MLVASMLTEFQETRNRYDTILRSAAAKLIRKQSTKGVINARRSIKNSMARREVAIKLRELRNGLWKAWLSLPEIRNWPEKKSRDIGFGTYMRKLRKEIAGA